MAIQTCPTAVVRAPPERIWRLLVDAKALAGWLGATLLDGPAWPLALGDRVVLGVGLGMKVVLEPKAIDPPRELALEVRLPLGVVNHEVVRIAPLDADNPLPPEDTRLCPPVPRSVCEQAENSSRRPAAAQPRGVHGRNGATRCRVTKVLVLSAGGPVFY